MQRRVTTLVGLAVLGLAVWLAVGVGHSPNGAGHDRAPGDGHADAGVALARPDAGSSIASGPVLPEPPFDGGAGSAMPDGSAVPPLPASVPRQVRFGVVLVSYEGAQASAGGGHPATRSRRDAKILADKLLATALQDFHAAVQQGDAGSADDVGRVKPGILEPGPEYALFTLAVDAVAGPIDTPRGYWIVKRLE